MSSSYISSLCNASLRHCTCGKKKCPQGTRPITPILPMHRLFRRGSYWFKNEARITTSCRRMVTISTRSVSQREVLIRDPYLLPVVLLWRLMFAWDQKRSHFSAIAHCQAFGVFRTSIVFAVLIPCFCFVLFPAHFRFSYDSIQLPRKRWSKRLAFPLAFSSYAPLAILPFLSPSVSSARSPLSASKHFMWAV